VAHCIIEEYRDYCRRYVKIYMHIDDFGQEKVNCFSFDIGPTMSYAVNMDDDIYILSRAQL